MKTCEICGKNITRKKYKHTCSKECSKIYMKNRKREYQKELRKKLVRMGLTVKEWRDLKRKEKAKIKKESTRVWYDKWLYVDWSKEELSKIKMCKDKAYV